MCIVVIKAITYLFRLTIEELHNELPDKKHNLKLTSEEMNVDIQFDFEVPTSGEHHSIVLFNQQVARHFIIPLPSSKCNTQQAVTLYTVTYFNIAVYRLLIQVSPTL